MSDMQDMYEAAVKNWVLEEVCEDTDSHDKSSHSVAVFTEDSVGDMDDTVKDRADITVVEDRDYYEGNVYSWNAVLIPVNTKLIMSADYTPRRRWYNPEGDYIENPAKYFLEAKQRGLEQRKAIMELLESVNLSGGKETMRSDLGLKRLTNEG